MIGFIGTGRMETPMAGNLLKAGHALVVDDARRAVAASLLAKGAPVARRAALASGDHVEVVKLIGDLEGGRS